MFLQKVVVVIVSLAFEFVVEFYAGVARFEGRKVIFQSILHGIF